MTGRKTKPTRTTNLNHSMPWRIWVNWPAYTEDPHPWKMVASFHFLADALDYIASLQDRGGDCVYQNPTDCRDVLATDRRMVAA